MKVSNVLVHLSLEVLVLVLVYLGAIASGQTVDFQDGLPTLRSLHRKCANDNITDQIFCVAFPPGCEKTSGYTCKLITTISKFDLPCIRSNLHDPYIRTLCAKRFSTYLVTILRHVTPISNQRTCENEFFHNRKRCISREFVAVAFSDSVTSDVEDNDLFYTCIADEPHITTWTKKGDLKILKLVKDADEYQDPYQISIFNESGIGIYWENLQDLKDKTEFVCEFVISVEPIDTEYIVNGAAADASHLLQNQLSPNITGFVKMVQGVVERKNETEKYVIERVNLDGRAPGNPNSGPILSDYKFASSDKPLNLSALEQSTSHLIVRNTRDNIHNDTALHHMHWDPVFTMCQDKSALCYVLDDDPGCFEENKEACELLVAIEFSDDFKNMTISMMVDNWQWGGISFSDDRAMADDIGFYCIDYGKSTFLKPMLNLKHSGKEGNDTKLADLVTVKENVTQVTDDKRFCSFTIPTVFNISKSPFNDSEFIDYDLESNDYYVLLAVGTNQNDAVAVHRKRSIVLHQFSLEEYLDVTGLEASASLLNPRVSILILSSSVTTIIFTSRYSHLYLT